MKKRKPPRKTKKSEPFNECVLANSFEPTPILYGKDAEEFLRRMRYTEEHPDPKKAKFLKECYEVYKKHFRPKPEL